MLEQALAEQIPKNHAKVCASVTLTGERCYEPDFPALRKALDTVFLHAVLTDRTTTRRSLWRYQNDDDLRGAVTRRYRTQIEAASSEEESAADSVAALTRSPPWMGKASPHLKIHPNPKGGGMH